MGAGADQPAADEVSRGRGVYSTPTRVGGMHMRDARTHLMGSLLAVAACAGNAFSYGLPRPYHPPPAAGAFAFEDVEKVMRSGPIDSSVKNCGATTDKYGQQTPAWSCVIWRYAEAAFVFDLDTHALVRCDKVTGTRTERRDPKHLGLMGIASGDPAMAAVGRELIRIGDPPYDVTIQVWSETPCKALLEEVSSRTRQ